jgi:uncharacterized RDD family membrane protein YckC
VKEDIRNRQTGEKVSKKRIFAGVMDFLIIHLISLPLFWVLKLTIAPDMGPSFFVNPLTIAALLMVFRDKEISLGSIRYSGLSKKLFGLRISKTDHSPIGIKDLFYRNMVFSMPLMWLAILLPLLSLSLNTFLPREIIRFFGNGFLEIAISVPAFLIWLIWSISETLSFSQDGQQRSGDRLAGTRVNKNS